jgi:uncharacterized protein
MKVALIGATGFVGQHILNEALSRNHEVTALVRNPSHVAQASGLIAKALNVHNSEEVTSQLVKHDAVIVSLSYEGLNIDSFIRAVKASGVPRLLVVGGAGSLEVAPNVQVVDTPNFPEEWKATALAARDLLNALRGERELDWTYLSPSAFLEPGERTGKFRLGTDQLLLNDKGESRISNQDYAVALIDELENPKHNQVRFTVGY